MENAKEPIEIFAHDEALSAPPLELGEEDAMALASVHSTYLQLENLALKTQLQLNEAVKELDKVKKQFEHAYAGVKKKYGLGDRDNVDPVTRKIVRVPS